MFAFTVRQPWLLTGILCFIVIFVALAYDMHRDSPLKKALHTRHIPTSIEEVKARHALPPENQNGAYLLLEAVENLSHVDETMKQTLPFTDAVSLNYGEALTPEQRETLQAYLAMNSESLRLIFEAVTYPYIQYPPEPLLTGDYAYYNAYSFYLVLRAALEAALSNDFETLSRAIKTGYRLSIADVPMNTTAYPRITSCMDFLRLIEYILAFINPGKETMLEWRDMATNGIYRNHKHYQQISRNILTAYFVSSRYSQFLDYGPDSKDVHAVVPRMLLEWTDILCTTEMAFVQDAFQAIDAGEQDIFSAGTYHGTFDEDRSLLLWFLHFPRAVGGNKYSPPYRQYARLYALANAARTALAAVLFQYDHGRLPETLEELVPEYLEAAPRDPFTPGDVIRYRVIDDVAVFYSIGRNERDDGGVWDDDCRECDDIIFRLKTGGTPAVPAVATQEQSS